MKKKDKPTNHAPSPPQNQSPPHATPPPPTQQTPTPIPGTDDLAQLLQSLRLRKIGEIIGTELSRAAVDQPSYTDFLRRLLRAEFEFRAERSIEYRLSKATLPDRWTLESFPFKLQPSVNPAVIRQLATLDFMATASNVVFIGGAGVGKTGLSTALLTRALQAGYRGRFVKAQDLFDDMYASLADRSTRALVKSLSRLDLLVIDEMGYLNLRPEQSNIFFKLMEERYSRHSTIITTNLEYEDWYEFLGRKEMVKALLDRLRHHCHTIRIDGDTLRTPST